MTPLLLAVDQGTTNTKAVLVDGAGQLVFRCAVPLELATPQPGFVEQDPEALWTSVVEVMRKAAAYARQAGCSIQGIGISNQRETAVSWHRSSGKPLGPAISWQCRRSAPLCQEMHAQADVVRQISGLPLDAVLTATKWAWQLEHVTAVQAAALQGELCLGTVDSWLLYRMSGGRIHATDHTNASRTGLLHLKDLCWADGLVAAVGLPADALPRLCASSGVFGACAAVPELEGVSIAAALGDSHAALAGHGAFRPGTIKATYGTGSSLMTLLPELLADTPCLARTVAWSTPGNVQFALEGNIFMTGSAVQWVGEFLSLTSPAADALALAATVPDAAGVVLIPAMAGLGAPHWKAEVQGSLLGLTRAHRAAHMARAALDAIAFQVADVFFAMQQASGVTLPALHADGGPTRNRALMQLQADVLGVPVFRSQNEELSAIGAAHLAGLALRWWASLDEIAALPHPVERLDPSPDRNNAQQMYAHWRAALRRVLLPEVA